MHRAILACIVGALDDDGAVLAQADGHILVEGLGEFTLGTLDGNGVAVDLYLDSGGNRNGSLPIRDMRLLLSRFLPDVCQDLAADAGNAGIAIGHDTFGRGNDGSAETTQNAGELVLASIDAEDRA